MKYEVTSFCYNGPRVQLDQADLTVSLVCVMSYSNGRVQLYRVLGFSCQRGCSSKSFVHFWNTRALVTAAQWSPVVSDLSITLFLKYVSLSRQICSVFDADPTFGCF